MPAILPIIIYAADIPGAGRFHADFISPQMAMELLCADVKNLSQVQDADGCFIDIQNWRGLRFNDDGDLISIDFDQEMPFNLFGNAEDMDDDRSPFTIGPGGSMDLKWIPKTVTTFFISDIEIGGTVDTLSLPRSLKYFDISSNKFYGTFDTSGLPENIETLDIHSNAFEGSLVIADLPRGTRSFSGHYNGFTGSIHLEDLPPKIEVFAVNGNSLTGTLNMRNLP